MAPRARTLSLRRTLLAGGLFLVFAAVFAMFASVSLVLSQQEAIARDSDAIAEEQRLAERIVALTYEQQLAAYRYLQESAPSYLDVFRSRGTSAFDAIHSYLFHDLSPDARLRVEHIKEVHERYEVAAQRAFELAQRGDSAAARSRVAGLDSHTVALDQAVRQFIQARATQHATFRDDQRARARWMQVALVLLAAGLIVAVVVLSRYLLTRVLEPLDELAVAARRLGQGDDHARMPEQRYPEFDALATGFNQMANDVQLSRETLAAQNEELQQTLDQLQRTLDHLRETESELVQHEKLSAMGEMLAGLAHELNNPLAGVLGMAEGLRQEMSESSDAATRELGREMAGPLEREALRAAAIVHSLLDFARKPSGALNDVTLAPAIATAVALRSHAFSLAGKTLQVQVPPDTRVVADAQKLQHCIVNLLNNALDAVIAAHGQGLTITATPERDRHVRLEFDDDGAGFVDPIAAFAPFYTTKPVGKGTGLGLALVQRFVTEFGGTVTASNPPGGGARITIRLRAARPADEAPATAAFPSASPAPAALAAPAGPPRPTPARILVVDDEPTLREVQRRILTRGGFEVVLASSGAEARDLVRAQSFDLVISDLRMPGEMDGRQLFAWLQVEHPALAARALLATGDVTGDAGSALPVTPDRLVNKPFHAADYLDRVRRALGLTSDK
jgi:C4-dicarboxylate-specific signal transduction histidine kinase/CheY-like chemotaxis protein